MTHSVYSQKINNQSNHKKDYILLNPFSESDNEYEKSIHLMKEPSKYQKTKKIIRTIVIVVNFIKMIKVSIKESMKLKLELDSMKEGR